MPLSLSGSLQITGSIVSPDFVLGATNPTYSSNLLTNGNFSGNADGWTLYSGVFYINNSLSASYTLGIPIASAPFSASAGKSYKVSFTLSDVANDTVQVYFDSISSNPIGLGNGTYEFITTPAEGQVAYQENIYFDIDNYSTGATYTLTSASVSEATIPGGVLFTSGSQTILDVFTDNTSRINIGLGAGSGSYYADQIFIGDRAGSGGSGAGSGVVAIGSKAAYGMQNNNSGITAVGDLAGERPDGSSYSIFIGSEAGNVVTSSANSVYIGYRAGKQAYNSNGSIFIGAQSAFDGAGVNGSSNSNFIGYSAGAGADQSSNSNFIGPYAGQNADNCSFSTFIGNKVGFLASNATGSFFVGSWTGFSTNAKNSIFIGDRSGLYQQNAVYSIFLGYQSGYNYNGISSAGQLGRNNIIIGTNIALEDGRQDSINIAGLIFATGSYFSDSYLFDNGVTEPLSGEMFSGSANGKVGINQPLPSYSLDVSGSIGLTDILVLGSKAVLPTTNVPSGSIMASGSDANFKPYFWNGSTWTSMVG